MVLKFPPSIAKRIDLQDYLHKRSLVNIVFSWIINWETRKSVNLRSYIREQLQNPVLDQIIVEHLLDTDDLTNKQKVRKVLKLVRNNIIYRTDNLMWDVDEYWQTPSETWISGRGDCEDGAILIYCLLHKIGVPDRLIRIACGDVIGGGHCYVVFRSDEDALEYPVDWCYWYNDSYLMRSPYVKRKQYNYSLTEWFSFNKENVYKAITY